MATSTEQRGRVDFPKGMSKPSRRALDTVGVTRLDQLQNFREKEIASLHGMGPKVLGLLKDALRENGISFAREQ